MKMFFLHFRENIDWIVRKQMLETGGTIPIILHVSMGPARARSRVIGRHHHLNTVDANSARVRKAHCCSR
jgi:hypothetical protein